MIGFRSRRRDTSALLQASLLAGTALLGVLGALVPAGAATLDLAGANTTLPRVGFFGGQAYVNGATDNVTNNGAAAAILSEGGGAAGTVYGGVVADGASRTGLTHTGGSVLLTGANTFSGGLLITGGTVIAGANQTLGATTNSVTLTAGTLGTGTTTEQLQALQVGGTGTVTVNNGGRLGAGAINLTAAGATFVVAPGGAATGALTNAGNVGNASLYTGPVVANTGNIGNAGAWNGAVALNNGAIGNVGQWTGNVVANNGNIGNNGLWTGSIANGATGILVTADKSVLAGPLTNNGRVLAYGGVFNGAIVNNGDMTLPGPGTVNASVYGPIVAAAAAGGLSGNGSVVSNGAVTNAGTLTITPQATYTINGGSLTNSGSTYNAGVLNATLANSGAAQNAATGRWTGGVSNIGSIGNDGAWAGALVNQMGGTVTNAGTWTGATTNASGARIFNSGTLNGGLTNAGSVYASGGAINGGIANAGLFDVAGVVTSDLAFTNQSGGSLAVTGTGSYTLQGGATLTNAEGGTIFVDTAAKLTDDLANSGKVVNQGTFTANVVNQSANAADADSGLIVNQGNWFGALRNMGGGVVTNTGTWTGDTTNDAGGIINASGTFAGNVVNNGSYNSTGSSVTGNFTNAGTITSTATTIGGTLANSGTIDLRQGGLTSNSITAQTYVSNAGAQAFAMVNLGTNAGGGQAGTFNFNTIQATAPTQLTLVPTNNSTPIGYYPSITVVAGDTNNVFQLTPASLASLQGNGGFVSYTYNGGVLTGQINAAKASTAGIQVASIVTTLNSDFFQDWQPFITAPQDPDVNSISGGPWVRGKYGNESIDSTARANGVNPAASRVDTEFSGFQVGGDVGVFNINKTGWNLIGGVTGGEVFATSNERLAGQIKGLFEIPFVGAYGALTNGPFHFDVLYRHDFYGLKLSDNADGLDRQKLVANGDSVSFDAGYNISLGTYGNLGNFFIEPNGSLIVSKVTIDPLNFSARNLGTLSFNDVDSTLGRFGFRLGTSTTVGKLALQPFMTAAVWHEFDGDTVSNFSASNGAGIVPLSVTRVGTFGQFGVGLNGELLGSNILGTIRADFRTGEKVDGQGVTAQLRYQF